MPKIDLIRCPNRHCGIDPKTGQPRGTLLATNAEVVGDLRGQGSYQIEIRCRRCKTIVKIVYSETGILVLAA